MTLTQSRPADAYLRPPPAALAGPTTASTRRTASLVGLLFLAATVTFILADKLITGVLQNPAYLTTAFAHTNALATGAMLGLVEGPATVGIAVLLFPLLKRDSEPMALAYVGLRIAELAAALLYVATPLLVMKVGAAVHNRSLDASMSHQLGALFQAQHSIAIVLIYLLTAVAGTILAILLYRSQLIPRPLAILGLVGYPVLLAGGVLSLFNAVDVTHGVGLLASVPGGLFELILPIRLFTKGFTFGADRESCQAQDQRLW
ncbi:MAG: DUF4386 domain-containing protein [Acidimicrobiales bacterium]